MTQAYTVLVLRPAWMGGDIFLAHVNAPTRSEAQCLARTEAFEADCSPEDRGELSEDEVYDQIREYRVDLMFIGHHYDVSLPE